MTLTADKQRLLQTFLAGLPERYARPLALTCDNRGVCKKHNNTD